MSLPEIWSGYRVGISDALKEDPVMRMPRIDLIHFPSHGYANRGICAHGSKNNSQTNKNNTMAAFLKGSRFREDIFK